MSARLVPAVLAAAVAFACPARAEFLVTEMTGTLFRGTAFRSEGGPPGPVGNTFGVGSFIDTIINTINGMSSINGIPIVGGGSHIFADVLLGSYTVGSVAFIPGGTVYTFGVPQPTPAFSASALFGPFPPGLGGGPGTGPGEVRMRHTSLTGLVPDSSPTTMLLSGEVALVSSSNTFFDFSGFSPVGSFEGTIRGSGFTSWNDFIAGVGPPPGVSGVGGNFTLRPLPEPSSLALAVLGAAGLLWRWRRTRRPPRDIPATQ